MRPTLGGEALLLVKTVRRRQPGLHLAHVSKLSTHSFFTAASTSDALQRQPAGAPQILF